MRLHLVYLRLLAILLIVNSHMDPVYPFSGMAFGGHLGNSLFFLLSGFGLAVSYRDRPIPPIDWATNRIIKVIIPVVLFLGVVYIGDLQGFVDHILKYLIWHDRSQLTEFLPVLWVLYVLFLPLNRLSYAGLRSVAAAVALLTLGLLLYRAQRLAQVPSDLPSSDIFFTLNAFLCFVLGIHLARQDTRPTEVRRTWRRPLLIAAMIVSQLLHAVTLRIGGLAIAANFYANFVTVAALYYFLEASPLGWSRRLTPVLTALASSSLAVYIIHSHIINIAAIGGPPFPYNALAALAYSFLFAYVLSAIAARLCSWTLQHVWTGSEGRPERQAPVVPEGRSNAPLP